MDLYWYEQEDGEALVAALRQLPHLRLSLGVHACFGTEANINYPDVQGYGDRGALPPLAGLNIIALNLIGRVRPPPDLHALPHLQSP